MLLVSLLSLATGVGAAPWCKDTPDKCVEGDKCEPQGVWGNCPSHNDFDHLGCSSKGFCRFFCDVSACDLGYVCVPEGNMMLCEPVPSPVPSPGPSPVPSPGPSCEDLADDTKKGKKRCKLAKKCNKLGPKSNPKLAKKCKQKCAKDACRKYNKKTGTCKKKGKNVCPKTCCNLIGSRKTFATEIACKYYAFDYCRYPTCGSKKDCHGGFPDNPLQCELFANPIQPITNPITTKVCKLPEWPFCPQVHGVGGIRYEVECS